MSKEPGLLCPYFRPSVDLTDFANLEAFDGSILAQKVNIELKFVKRLLDANKLSLNIDKTNYVIFHSTSSSIPTDTVIKIGKNSSTESNMLSF